MDDATSPLQGSRTLAQVLARTPEGVDEARAIAWAADLAAELERLGPTGPPIRLQPGTVVIVEGRARIAEPDSERDLLLEMLGPTGPPDPVRDLAAVVYAAVGGTAVSGATPTPVPGVSLLTNQVLMETLDPAGLPPASPGVLVDLLRGRVTPTAATPKPSRRTSSRLALGTACVATATALAAAAIQLFVRGGDDATLATPAPVAATATIAQPPLAAGGIGAELAAVDRDIVEAAAVKALDRWRVIELPDPLYDRLHDEATRIARHAEAGEQRLVAGDHAEARAMLEESVTSMLALLGRHRDAADAAASRAREWQRAVEALPVAWLDDGAVHGVCNDAQVLAAEASDAAVEARYDDAIESYADAVEQLHAAVSLNDRLVAALLHEVRSLRARGDVKASLDRLEEVAPFLDDDLVREERIAGYLVLARSRNARATRKDARQAIEAALELDPQHADALALRAEIADHWTARRGDVVVNSLSQTLIFVDPGVFEMGSPRTELYHQRSERRHPVRLTRGFWMSRVEVTRGQFAKFVAATRHVTDGESAGWSLGLRPDGQWDRLDEATWRMPGFVQTDNHPAVCVSFNDAIAFCRWLSDREGRRYRLPTEAEWEFACRAGTDTAYVWGSDPYEEGPLCNGADETWLREHTEPVGFQWFDGYVYTSPVASFPANGYGLFDMHANVAEWCADAYASYPTDEQVDPFVTGDEAEPRVIRGGSFGSAPPQCRSAHRDANRPDSRFTTVGFRIVLED